MEFILHDFLLMASCVGVLNGSFLGGVHIDRFGEEGKCHHLRPNDYIRGLLRPN